MRYTAAVTDKTTPARKNKQLTTKYQKKYISDYVNQPQFKPTYDNQDCQNCFAKSFSYYKNPPTRTGPAWWVMARSSYV
jgi:hypothetical protein